ncbi:DUF4349 domain-containing protein [Psychrobacillus lasiicapitis]|uniref:DUF4349 domain-containing protein n=1 Tax=Psychrobacillus lasiicapitis TaxID=1636719 RepID=A0A544SX44_9BACI|nr:DUF4349 domain-containing protein [Psychrobacillus lasiicapitis]TQR09780.1 DUF4349 domain-containing protein [Psychrobacillus lasiicapitis]GGA23438.1 hypothetical protein GCM10011384_11340 [Psychrobacillus lasiicapitis]
MKKGFFYFLLLVLLGFLGACSAAEESKSVSEMDSVNDSAAYVEKEESLAVEGEEKSTEEPVEATDQRMIIHNAIIRTNVKELAKAQSNIEQKVKEYGGYIVESNVYKQDDQTSNGHMIVRIPEKHFETFLSDAEGEASKVLERNVTGQDVTEQYVDLSSRLKSKRVVEERLLTFMEGAEKTEDLLKISSDLAKVQEEIEVIVGKMKYLENQSSFSTIELTMIENRVIVPGIENNDLNTWEKTKKQFVTSTNTLLAGGSAILVFFIGNLPVFLILGVIAFVVYWIIKRRRLVQKK